MQREVWKEKEALEQNIWQTWGIAKHFRQKIDLEFFGKKYVCFDPPSSGGEYIVRTWAAGFFTGPPRYVATSYNFFSIFPSLYQRKYIRLGYSGPFLPWISAETTWKYVCFLRGWKNWYTFTGKEIFFKLATNLCSSDFFHLSLPPICCLF